MPCLNGLSIRTYIFCPNCNTKIVSEDAKFCHNCAYDLRGVRAPASMPVGGDNVSGLKVGEDYTAVGNIENSKNIAIGKDIQLSEYSGQRQGGTYIENVLPQEVFPSKRGCYADVRNLSFAVVAGSFILIALMWTGIIRNGPSYVPTGPLSSIKERLESLLATATPVPTVIEIPTPTVVAAAASPSPETPISVTGTPVVATAMVTTQIGVDVRNAPNIDADILGVANDGEQFLIIGVDSSGAWLGIDFKGETGWIPHEFVTVQNADNVPVIDSVPTQTPEPVTQNAQIAPSQEITLTGTPGESPITQDVDVALAMTPATISAIPQTQSQVTGGTMLEGELPPNTIHYVEIETPQQNASVVVSMTIQPAENSEALRATAFYVILSTELDNISTSTQLTNVAIAMGNRLFSGPSNERTSNFTAVGATPYTVLIQNSSQNVTVSYTLEIDGDVIVLDNYSQ